MHNTPFRPAAMPASQFDGVVLISGYGVVWVNQLRSSEPASLVQVWRLWRGQCIISLVRGESLMALVWLLACCLSLTT